MTIKEQWHPNSSELELRQKPRTEFDYEKDFLSEWDRHPKLEMRMWRTTKNSVILHPESQTTDIIYYMVPRHSEVTDESQHL